MHVFITKWNGGHELTEEGGDSGFSLAFLLSSLTFYDIPQSDHFSPSTKVIILSLKRGQKSTVDSM